MRSGDSCFVESEDKHIYIATKECKRMNKIKCLENMGFKIPWKLIEIGLSGADEIIQKRKWRAYLLKSLTDTANEDSLQGMLALMEFWNAMGMPATCPFAFPASADRKCLSKYFSKSSYKKCLENNRKWLGEEITEIVLLETS